MDSLDKRVQYPLRKELTLNFKENRDDDTEEI